MQDLSPTQVRALKAAREYFDKNNGIDLAQDELYDLHSDRYFSKATLNALETRGYLKVSRTETWRYLTKYRGNFYNRRGKTRYYVLGEGSADVFQPSKNCPLKKIRTQVRSIVATLTDETVTPQFLRDKLTVECLMLDADVEDAIARAHGASRRFWQAALEGVKTWKAIADEITEHRKAA